MDKPTNQAALDEITAIRTDPSHPMHQRYLAKDAAVHDHVNELWLKAYPGEIVVGERSTLLDDMFAKVGEEMELEAKLRRWGWAKR